MEGEARTFIDAPADQVWGMLADVTRMAEWSPECTRCEWLDGATGAGIGVRFRARAMEETLRRLKEHAERHAGR